MTRFIGSIEPHECGYYELFLVGWVRSDSDANPPFALSVRSDRIHAICEANNPMNRVTTNEGRLFSCLGLGGGGGRKVACDGHDQLFGIDVLVDRGIDAVDRRGLDLLFVFGVVLHRPLVEQCAQ